MDASDDFSAVEALDLNAIKVKLMHPKSGKGWSQQRAEAAEQEYRRFLYLAKKFPNEPTAPLVDVDEFWHYHILDTMKYAADCDRVFGYFLHHFPYAGMRGKADEAALQRMGERTRALYEQTFGEDYFESIASAAGRHNTALSSGTRLDAANGAPPRMAKDRDDAAESAYCVKAAAVEASAYCVRASETAAYCVKTPEAQAYCVRAPEASAYCVRAAETPAYCVRAVEASAYCVRAVDASAYCVRALDASAYCVRSPYGSDVLELENPPESTAATAAPFTNEDRPEYRFGYYLERPGLPV
jgi:hypothetical protein